MIVGINGNEANVTHRVGVGQYVFELLCALRALNAPRLKYRIYLQAPPMVDMPPASSDWEYVVLPGHGLWTFTRLQGRLIKEALTGSQPDVFFSPAHYAPFYLPCPSVVSIMDLSHEQYPRYFKKKDLYQLKYWTKLSAKQAAKIITISQYSRDQIIGSYHLKPQKIQVTPLGFDRQRFNPKVMTQRSKTAAALKKYGITTPYLIFLGTLQPKKNLPRLIEAFSQLPNPDLKLVIVGMVAEGRGGWMYREIFAKVKSLGLENRVIFTGYAPDQDVPYLFAGSLAFILPSLYEGFGIPAIEAMAVGVPVVVSKVASLGEVCGQAAIYISDPTSVSSIRSALEQMLHLKAGELVKRVDFGLDWVKRYNWNTTAAATLNILTEAASVGTK